MPNYAVKINRLDIEPRFGLVNCTHLRRVMPGWPSYGINDSIPPAADGQVCPDEKSSRHDVPAQGPNQVEAQICRVGGGGALGEPIWRQQIDLRRSNPAVIFGMVMRMNRTSILGKQVGHVRCYRMRFSLCGKPWYMQAVGSNENERC
jgi:hypothetical protein